MRLSSAVVVIGLILFLDQFSKFFVKTNFVLGQEMPVYNWFRLHFIENEGMAWGTEIPGAYGKLFLTVFRLVAVTGIGYWLYDSCERKYSTRYLVLAISFIFAGALGNIIDSVFYGVYFEDSHGHIAKFMSDSHYGTWFHGKVVDLFYFPIIENGTFPDWLPIWGGKQFTFFNAIFNIADFSISVGVGILILFNKRAFKNMDPLQLHYEANRERIEEIKRTYHS